MTLDGFCCGAATFVVPSSSDGTAGSCTTNAVSASPPSIHTRPPCSATIVETMASPRPVPPGSRGRPSSSRTKRSNTRCRSATGIPGPSSATMSVAVGPAALSPPDDGGSKLRRLWTVTVPLACRRALSRRFCITRRSRAVSPRRVRARYLWCRSSAGLLTRNCRRPPHRVVEIDRSTLRSAARARAGRRKQIVDAINQPSYLLQRLSKYRPSSKHAVACCLRQHPPPPHVFVASGWWPDSLRAPRASATKVAPLQRPFQRR